MDWDLKAEEIYMNTWLVKRENFESSQKEGNLQDVQIKTKNEVRNMEKLRKRILRKTNWKIMRMLIKSDTGANDILL